MTDLGTWAAIITALGLGQLVQQLFKVVTDRGGAKAALHQTEAVTEDTIVGTATKVAEAARANAATAAARMAAAEAKADRCVEQLDLMRDYLGRLHDHVDALERLCVTHGVLPADIPPMPRLPPAPLGFPTPQPAGG